MVMAFVMATVIIAGFSLNLAMGRSTFAAPFAVHVHAGIFMGWLALYLAQHVTAASRNWPLHRSLGKLAYFWIPAMIAAGCTDTNGARLRPLLGLPSLCLTLRQSAWQIELCKIYWHN